jgi:hypothetical protein
LGAGVYIFSGATYNVEQMNDKVRDEINKLFVEDKRMVVYLAGQEVKINQGKTWGVAFAIKNLNVGESQASEFDYKVKVQSDVVKECKMRSDAEALSYIKAGQSETHIKIAPGQTAYRIIRFQIPEAAPLCLVRYAINVNNGDYTSDFFDLTITPK